MGKRHLRPFLAFSTAEILHFAFKRAMTPVLATGEEYTLQSCCGTIPRPRHPHMNTQRVGRNSHSGHPHIIVGARGNLTSLLQPSLLSDRHQNNFKAKLRRGHGNVANLYPVLWPEIGSVTLPHRSVFSQQLNGETIDFSTNITYFKECLLWLLIPSADSSLQMHSKVHVAFIWPAIMYTQKHEE